MAKRKARGCHYCGTPLNEDNKTKDHIVPKSRGGTNAMWNIVWSCRKCNNQKKDGMPTCQCRKCSLALVAWARGIRRGSGAHLIANFRDELLIEPERLQVPLGRRGKEGCLQACRINGCCYPTRCFAPKE